MKKSLLEVLRAPNSKKPLILYVLLSESSSEGEEEDVIEGILVSEHTPKKAYPIIHGVPIMLDDSFSRDFLSKHAVQISANEVLNSLGLVASEQTSWSFSSEWDHHFDSDLLKTWGWTIDARVQQFFLETGLGPEDCKGKMILDAGCGNGQLSEGLCKLGATIVALDYSTSVLGASRRRKSPNVHFVQGDLQAPPLAFEVFDLVISNGVIHHTKDTYKTFIKVAELVKPFGRFYLWLYRKPESFGRRVFLYPIFDFMRLLVSRLPPFLQAFVVKCYARSLMIKHKLLGASTGRSWQEYVVAAYDSLTPFWRHYHTPLEVSCWFFKNGYSHSTLTHWDNPWGFGVVAMKEAQDDTPGVNFGKVTSIERYYN